MHKTNSSFTLANNHVGRYNIFVHVTQGTKFKYIAYPVQSTIYEEGGGGKGMFNNILSV